MSLTMIEWLVAAIFLATLVLLIAARVHFVRRPGGPRRDADWLAGSSATFAGDGGCSDGGSTGDGGACGGDAS